MRKSRRFCGFFSGRMQPSTTPEAQARPYFTIFKWGLCGVRLGHLIFAAVDVGGG